MEQERLMWLKEETMIRDKIQEVRGRAEWFLGLFRLYCDFAF